MRIIEIMTLQDGVYSCNGLEYTETIASGATGTILYFPASVRQQIKAISIILIAGANTGKFQATLSPLAAIEASTPTWFDLDIGATTGTVADAILDPITGLRGVSTSGEIKIEVVI